MSDLTSQELRQIEASHFMAIAQALISQANQLQCEALKNLVFWRQRDLRAEKVRLYKPGEVIIYLLEDSKTEAEGTIHHLNKLSVSIYKGAGQFEAIPVERILRWKKAFAKEQVLVLEVAHCPDGLLPDGPICPRCGGNRAPSGIDGGTWVHFNQSQKNLELRDGEQEMIDDYQEDDSV